MSPTPSQHPRVRFKTTAKFHSCVCVCVSRSSQKPPLFPTSFLLRSFFYVLLFAISFFLYIYTYTFARQPTSSVSRPPRHTHVMDGILTIRLYTHTRAHLVHIYIYICACACVYIYTCVRGRQTLLFERGCFFFRSPLRDDVCRLSVSRTPPPFICLFLARSLRPGLSLCSFLTTSGAGETNARENDDDGVLHSSLCARTNPAVFPTPLR